MQRTGPERPPLTRRGVAWLTAALAVVAAVVATTHAASAAGGYQRGPDPTVASVAATLGPFATAQMSVPAGNGFNGGTVYYPTDTSLGRWGAVAIVPGYSALFANEEAWMGPRLASFGFVVLGIETNSRTDGADARATELLAALDYLTQRSAVRDRVDPDRLAVMGHSAGGAGALLAAMRRPSLKAVIGLAPGSPTGLSDLTTDRVPTLFVGGQTDPTVTPAYLDRLYATLPTTTQSAYVQLSGADHLFFTRPNDVEIRRLVPWMKVFLDGDARYTQFMCPAPADSTGLSRYSAKCPLVPPAGPSSSASAPSSPSASASASASASPSASASSPAPGGACVATYRTVGSWQGGFQGEVTVTAGSAPVTGWTVRWTLGSGQSITQVWNAVMTINGSIVTIRNAPYNGSLPAAGSTTFGFLATGSASAPALSCTTA